MNNFIEDDIGVVVAAMREIPAGPPYYLYGHKSEINARLLLKNTSPTEAKKKYPLVALKLDSPADVVNGFLEWTLNIAILTYTNKNYNASERLANVFKPTLEPLYESFMEELQNVALFTWLGDQRYPPHSKVYRYFYGTIGNDANTANGFDDPLDAIELVNLKIKTEIKNC